MALSFHPFLAPVNSCDGRYAASLDVRFTRICDNACSFCIEAPGIPERGTKVAQMVASTLASPQRDVLILGGEPLLMLDRVIEYVSAIREYKASIYLTTSLPRTISTHMDRTVELVRLLDGINISLQHHDAQRNNEILVARNRHNRIELLRDMLANEEIASKARVSINLVKGGIDNATDLNTFLDLMSEIGCRHVKINELQNTPDSYVSYERIMGTRMASPFAYGCQDELDLREGMRVTLKRSCFLVEDTLTASVADLGKMTARRLLPMASRVSRTADSHGVMYEDGFLASGWLTRMPKEN
jgi:pyruvate-formate lyase-activating enzyme